MGGQKKASGFYREIHMDLESNRILRDKAEGPCYIRNLAEKELEFGQVHAAYDINDLFSRAV